MVVVDFGHLLISKPATLRQQPPTNVADVFAAGTDSLSRYASSVDNTNSLVAKSELSVDESTRDDEDQFATPPESFTPEPETDGDGQVDRFESTIDLQELEQSLARVEAVQDAVTLSAQGTTQSGAEHQPVDASTSLNHVESVISTDSRIALVASAELQRFTIQLSDVQVLVGRFGDPWKAALLAAETSALHLVEKFSIGCSLLLSHPDRTTEAEIAVEASLPALRIHLSDDKIVTLATVAFLAQSAVQRKSPTQKRDEHALRKQSLSESTIHEAFGVPVRGQYTTLLRTFHVSVGSVFVNLCNDPTKEQLIGIAVSGVVGDLRERPYDRLVCFSVSSFQIVDFMQKPESNYRYLASTQNASAPSSDTFIQLTFAAFSPTPDKLVCCHIFPFKSPLSITSTGCTPVPRAHS